MLPLADPVLPQVAAVAPAPGETEVASDAAVRVTIQLHGSALDLTTLGETTVMLTDTSSGETVPATRELSEDGSALLVRPTQAFGPDTTYRFSVTSGLQTESGAPFTPFESSFTTSSAPAPDELPAVTTLNVSNPLGVPFDTRLVLHHILNTSGNLCQPELDPGCDNDAEPWADLAVRDTGVLELENTGDQPLQLSLSLTAPEHFGLPNGESALTLQPGEPYELTVQFAPTGPIGGEDKGVTESTLLVQTGDASTEVELAGLFMSRPESHREVFLEGIIEAFGYPIDVGANAQGGLSSADPNSPLAGDEVRSAYWQVASADSPVVVTQIAAFHSCCFAGEDFEMFYEGQSTPFANFRSERTDGQTLFPRLQGGEEVAGLSTEPTDPFEMRSANYSTDPSLGRGEGNLGFRLWPLKDRSGEPIANSYVAAMDFVEDGCGTTASANCDYNDNMYVIENIEPAN